MNNEYDNLAVLERLRAGDEEALADAFFEYRDRLRRLISFRLDRRLYGRVDADDILQEAFLDATRRIEHFFEDSSQSLFIWLRLIVCQTMIGVHRRHLGTKMRDVTREISFHHAEYPQATSVSLANHVADSISTPSHIAMRDEARLQLETAIQQMSEIDQEILALRHFEELTNKEVAEVLGIEVKAASIRYVRALKRLQEIMESVSRAS